MSRSARLLALLQVLRRHRQAVTGAALANELGISLRTLYLDIATSRRCRRKALVSTVPPASATCFARASRCRR